MAWAHYSCTCVATRLCMGVPDGMMRQCICDCPGHHLSEARQGAEGTRDEGCSRQGACTLLGEFRRLAVEDMDMGQGADGSPWGT